MAGWNPVKINPVKNLLLLLVCLGFSLTAEARPLVPEDIGYNFEKYYRKVLVHEDGSVEIKNSMVYRINSDLGMQAFRVYQLYFDKNREEVADLSVRIEAEGSVYTVPPQDIEEKALFSGTSGFDETRTKVIPLPGIAIGARIFIDYTGKILKPGFAGSVMGRFPQTTDTVVDDYYFEIQLPKNVVHHIHDPSAAISGAVVESKTQNGSKLVLARARAKNIGTFQEENTFLPARQMAWIEYSNAPDFLTAGKMARAGFEKTLSEEMPEKLLDLFDEVSKMRLTSDADGERRLAQIFKILTKNFRYFADWRTVDGGYVSRPLTEVMRTGYGDCKDFAALVVRTASLVGLSGDVALVFRGTDNFDELDFPNLSAFNHAIARIKKPFSEGYWWVDATNLVNHVGLVPRDISGRKALVLSDQPELIKTGTDAPEVSTAKATYDFDVSGAPHLKISILQEESGYQAWLSLVDLLGTSEQGVREYVLTEMMGLSISETQDFNLERFEKSEGAPFSVSAKAQALNRFGIRRSGELKVMSVWTFGSAHHRIMDVVAKERGSDLDLGFFRRAEFTQRLKAGSFSELVGVPKGCEIHSPWLDLKREVQQSDGLVISDSFTVKRERIFVEEIKTPDFQNLQEQLRDCLTGISVVFK